MKKQHIVSAILTTSLKNNKQQNNKTTKQQNNKMIERQTTVEHLPKMCLVEIFKGFGPTDLAAVYRVSHKWRQLASFCIEKKCSEAMIAKLKQIFGKNYLDFLSFMVQNNCKIFGIHVAHCLSRY